MGRLLTRGSRWVEKWLARGLRAHSWLETHINFSSAGNILEELRRRTKATEGKVSLGWGWWQRAQELSGDRTAAALPAAYTHSVTEHLRAQGWSCTSAEVPSMACVASELSWRTAVMRTALGKVALVCCRNTLRVGKKRLVPGICWDAWTGDGASGLARSSLLAFYRPRRKWTTLSG